MREAVDTEIKTEENSEEESPVALRRSSCVSRMPSYLEDYELICEDDDEYELLCEIEVEHLLLLANEEPWNYEEAKELK